MSSGRAGGPAPPGSGDVAQPAVGVAICDGDRVRVADAALARLAGVEGPDKLAGQRLGDLLQHDGPDLPQPDGAAHACRLRRGDGSRLPVHVHVVDVPPDDASVWVFEDVSRLRALEDRLAGEVADREDLLTMLSHELRTPVTVIAGYARLLLSDRLGPLTPEQRRCVSQCERSSRRLVDLIGRLLEGAARARGELCLDLATGEVAPVVGDVAASLAPLLEPDRLRLEVELDPGAGHARFDRVRLEQVLTNLLANAIRYSPPGGTIRVLGRRVAEGGRTFVELAVCDQGPGVPAGDRERIFEPYVRGAGARGDGGLGLGLAIARRLIRAQGGSIRAGEAPGGGARFVFRLPAAGEG